MLTKKGFYRFCGFSFFAIGTLGVFLPLLPTVPFYLLAVFFLSKTSKRDLVRLKKLPLLGKRIYPYIKKSARYLKRWSTQ